MLEDEALRLALLSCEAMPALLPRLRALARRCTAALAASLRQGTIADGAADELDQVLLQPDQAHALALPTLAVACRAALHLQLMSALVADAAAAQHSAAGAAQAEEPAEGEYGAAGEGGRADDGGEAQPAQHMWSLIGQEALAEAVSGASRLLEALRGARLPAGA